MKVRYFNFEQDKESIAGEIKQGFSLKWTWKEGQNDVK